MGFAYLYNALNSDFRDAFSMLNPLDDVHGGEVYYNAAITPWFRPLICRHCAPLQSPKTPHSCSDYERGSFSDAQQIWGAFGVPQSRLAARL